MSVHELLQLAAKAQGWIDYPDDSVEQGSHWYTDREKAPFCPRICKSAWNPRESDGDALRLAVSIPSLNLQWIIAEAWQAHEDMQGRSAYVRLAILRAAAEVGRAMP